MKITKEEASKIAAASSFIEGYKVASLEIQREAKKIFKKVYGH